ncbi:carbohydrate ABC transporter permease [Jiangella alba]|uniref:Carbohydrate ABC transporter membrane protein 2, CUT1 family n=1 Tax=Jiangella alba TaxID=561176 RepID=A0A1H5MN40_9ACTN|nr:carbohydrate ABC transporter permease [Jiangella alba]SEE90550.1 carbohydrate ABC transporter membrane protein 2, CUT1 family [Jiangella alba]
MDRYTWRTGVREAVMIATAIVFAFPLYILVNIALKPSGDTSSALSPATAPTLENFQEAWQRAGLGGAIANSAIVTVVSVTIIVVVSAAAAYPIARATARWSTAAFYTFMVGLLLPLQLALIPLYQTMRDLGLLGTITPLILLYCGLRVPFSIFLYVQFLRLIPVDYEEAASIDGCSPLQTFRRVVFPLLRPVTGTVIILNGLFVWNDFLSPLLYLSGSANQTVPVAIYGFVGQYASEWELVFAALIIGALPVLIAYFFLQRSLIQGFASGVKG